MKKRIIASIAISLSIFICLVSVFSFKTYSKKLTPKKRIDKVFDDIKSNTHIDSIQNYTEFKLEDIFANGDPNAKFAKAYGEDSCRKFGKIVVDTIGKYCSTGSSEPLIFVNNSDAAKFIFLFKDDKGNNIKLDMQITKNGDSVERNLLNKTVVQGKTWREIDNKAVDVNNQ